MSEVYLGKNYIDGQWGEHRKDFSSLNPATEEPVAWFPQTPAVEVRAAVNAAKVAQKKWRKVSRVLRGELLKKVAQLVEHEYFDRLCDAISIETGKNYNESVAEVNEALHMAEYAWGCAKQPYGEVIASELADKDAYMLRKPVGVVAIVSPWNFPVAIAGFWNAAPALVEGNTVVWKPSEDTPMCAQIVTELYERAGVPAGVFNLLHGDGEVGEALVQEDDVNVILFTGSAEVGQKIRMHCASTFHKTCSCEMGSKSACLVFEDAWQNNPEMAVDACIASSFKLSGQRCVSSSRHLIQRSVYDEFCTEFSRRVTRIKTGPYTDDKSFYGPIINKAQLERVGHYNEIVRKDENVEILNDGSFQGKGYFSLPFVYKTEWRDVPYLKDEVFGPHVALIPFDTVDDAIRIYNDTEYGLAVGILTNNHVIARQCRDECEYGMCYWNGGSIAAESHLGFGGVKKSGNGYSSAARTYQAVTHEVAWTVSHANNIQFPQGMKANE
jgi:aldehyde dehydrogenase (NAD+)